MFLLLPVAFISGLLTALSPCVLPILPIILGSSIDGKKERPLGIIVGLIFSFSFFALFLSWLVSNLGLSADLLRNIAVILLLLFGLALIYPKYWNKISAAFENKLPQPAGRSPSRADFAGGLLTGAVLGLVWTPCIGPIVATVVTLSAINQFSLFTFLLVFTFSLGFGIVLLLIAFGGARVSMRLGIFKQKGNQIRRWFGIIVIATAILIATGYERRLQSWLLASLPESWTQIATTVEDRFNIDDELKKLRSSKLDKQTNKALSGEIVINKNVPLASDFSGAKVQKSDLIRGCPGKDCIPALDNPKFESTAQADNWLHPDDKIFAINLNGHQRAYPQRILNWHEIVNDELSCQDPTGCDKESLYIAVTFCPLCGSALTFERKVNGVITEFGVSGFLHNNDLVMYDRFEGSLWQQITGEAIVGKAARRNEQLKLLSMTTTTWAEWKQEHPDTQVLSRDTGHFRDYDHYPYGTYEQDETILFGIKELNRALHPKEVVYGIEVEGASKAYPENLIKDKGEFTDTIGNTAVTITRLPSGDIDIINSETKESYEPIRLFWFAWAAFHPDTELYQ